MVVPSAHTGLESSTPGANPTVQPTDKLTLRFESEIEAGGSLQVSAVDASDILEGTFTQENERMILTLDRPMAPGKYQVDWKIIGTDGHPINVHIHSLSYQVILRPNQKRRHHLFKRKRKK